MNQFLDFPRLPQWTQAQFQSIQPQTPTPPLELKAGDRLTVRLEGGMAFSPVILVRSHHLQAITTHHPHPSMPQTTHPLTLSLQKENTPTLFSWRGSIPLLFHGDHFFHFQPSENTAGGTTFVHGEEFSGLLSGVFAWFGKGEETVRGFERFNRDLKAEAEQV